MKKRRRGRPPHDDVLTPTEWRTVDAVRHGLRNREIAERRGVSLDAVKFHVANAVAKLGVANKRALRLWRGVPNDSAVAARGVNMSTNLELGEIGQVARSVSDAAASEQWYRDVLGLAHLYTYGTLVFFDCGGTRLMLSQQEGSLPAESILYFRVGDIQQAHQRLERRGVVFTAAPHMIHRHDDGTEEWMAFFKDPDERALGIMASVQPG